MAGRPEGGATERNVADCSPSEATQPTATVSLRDGRFALSISLPFGQAEARDLARLVASAEALGIDDIRLAPGRTIIALCPSRETAKDLRNTATALGFVTDPADPRRSISACPGSPACASGKMPARRMAFAIARQAAGLLDGSISLHVSGCVKGCAHPGTAALTLVGTESGVGLVANGTARDEPLAYEPDEKAVVALSRVAAMVASERRAKEVVATCLTRLGATKLAAAFSDGE